MRCLDPQGLFSPIKEKRTKERIESQQVGIIEFPVSFSSQSDSGDVTLMASVGSVFCCEF